MEQEFKNIESPVHTEQIQDIIGTPPSWLYRWGITVVLAIALICILISLVINYPESVKAQLKIVSMHPPYKLSINDSARLIKILVPNDVAVQKGDDLAVIEKATNKTIIKAPVSGKLTYVSIIHEDELFAPGRGIFFISRGYEDFYGKMTISQNDIYKIKPKQTVLIMIESSDERQTTLKGTIRYIVNDQLKSRQYFAEVDFDIGKNDNGMNYLLLSNGMIVNAEIITTNATLFQRLVKSLTKGIK